MSITITKRHTLYTFEELDGAAKDAAVRNLLDDPYYFWADIDAEKSWIVDTYFTNGPRPEWQGAFSFTQGDGFNLYGEMSYNDLRACAGLKPISDDFTVNIAPNANYTYCMWEMWNNGQELLHLIEEERGEAYARRQEQSVSKICEAMHGFCKQLREYGEWLIFEGYYDPSIYEGQLFDEFGNYQGCFEDFDPCDAGA